MRGYIDATDGQGGLAPTPHGRSTFSKNVGRKRGRFGRGLVGKSRKYPKIDEHVGNLGFDHFVLHVLLTLDLNR